MAAEKVTKKRKAPVPETDDPQPKKTRTTRVSEKKTAIEATNGKTVAVEKKSTAKKPAKATKEPASAVTAVKVTEKPKTKKAVKVTKAPSPEREATPLEDYDALEGFGSDSDASDEGAKDQTADLVGFEPEAESEIELAALPDIPDAATTALSTRKLPAQAEPGVLYLSRVPRGFHEKQMRAYFSQFGDVNRVRLARNRRTGKSKHHGWLEFAHKEVAAIAAETMNNYLLFGHLLKVKVAPEERLPENLWKGSEKRFKRIPWNAIERSRLAKTDREGWGKRVGREEKRRKSKADKLKEMGYEYVAPKLRAVDDVEVQKALPSDPVQNSAEVAVEAIEAPKEDEVLTIEKVIAKPKKGKSESVQEKVTVKVKKAEDGNKTNKAVKTNVKGEEKATKRTKSKAVKA